MDSTLIVTWLLRVIDAGEDSVGAKAIRALLHNTIAAIVALRVEAKRTFRQAAGPSCSRGQRVRRVRGRRPT